MKTKITFFALFLSVVISVSAQQMPNGGLNTWTNNISPDSWADIESTINSPFAGVGSLFTFKDAADKVEGTASAKLVSDSIPGQGVIPAFLSLVTAVFDTVATNIIFYGLPFTSRPDTLFFAYKYSSASPDTGSAFIILHKGGDPDAILNTTTLLTANSNWVFVTVPLTGLYANNHVPDTLQILFDGSIALRPVNGTTLHVDGVRLGYCTATAATLTAGA